MSFRPSRRLHYSEPQEELNLTPIMNIFMIIVPFLLLTVVFAKTAIIDVYLPHELENSSSNNDFDNPVILSIDITENGFKLGGIGKGTIIPKGNGNYDLKRLSEELIKIKEGYPQKEDIILLSKPNIPYGIIVKVMDTARESTDGNSRALFPAVSLGEVEE